MRNGLTGIVASGRVVVGLAVGRGLAIFGLAAGIVLAGSTLMVMVVAASGIETQSAKQTGGAE